MKVVKKKKVPGKKKGRESLTGARKRKLKRKRKSVREVIRSRRFHL